MSFLIIFVFVAGYLAIALEHSLQLNKAASALITGVVCWAIYIIGEPAPHTVAEELLRHLGEIASILFFLMGAMTIVELIDAHDGFDIITQKISTTGKSKLLLLIAIISFILSAMLDNLTTSIVMASLCTKLLPEREDRLWFCGMIVISANAGGAWSPLGDVTTTMLWIGGQVTAINIMQHLIFPSIAVCIVPVAIIAWKFRGQKLPSRTGNELSAATAKKRNDGVVILCSGIFFLLFVPVFKTLTHLPPFMGMLLALGLMWVITTIIHNGKDTSDIEKYNVASALQKIDTPSILFFIGILLATSALQSAGILRILEGLLNHYLVNDYAIGAVLGLLSALVDNVPLVAASQGMYSLAAYPTNHPFWEFLALTTGTGGSIIIIGSAAGVAIMGIEKINFIWYLKKISWLSLIGFVAGIIVFLVQIYF